MSTPTFSIAIPAFKRTFLRECIQSVLDQTCQDFELIIVNDNSPENLDDIVYLFSDPRIHYSKNETGFGAYNVSRNWDKCLNLAHGTFFMCMGDDDKLLPDCLENYLRLIESFPGINLFHARTQWINENSSVFDQQDSLLPQESVWSMIWHRWFKGRKMCMGDFLFRTSVLKDMGGFIWFPYAWGSDEQTVYAIAFKEGGVANMQDFGFQFRISTQSISGSGNLYKEKTEAWRLGKEWIKEFLQTKPSNPDDIYYWQALNEGLDHYYKERFGAMVRQDFRDNSLIDFHYWMKHRNKYGLTIKDIMKYLIVGLKQRAGSNCLVI